MNRRGFLSNLVGVAGAVSVPVVLASHDRSDDFQYRGWRVRWRGWVEPVNQLVTIGFWVAERGRAVHPDYFWASTTLGDVGKYHELDVLSMNRKREWPILTPFSTVAERDAMKHRALDALLGQL